MFRPLPVLTLFTLPALALLIWLGAWQWGRMGEKTDAIAAWEQRVIPQPVTLETLFCSEQAELTGRPVLLSDSGRVSIPSPLESQASIRFLGRDFGGEPGWRVMAALPMPECFAAGEGRSILVEYQFFSLNGEYRHESTAIITALPPQAGVFTLQNDLQSGEFYRFVPEDLERALGTGIYPDLWVIGYSGDMPPELAQVPPGQHLGYALTWWGMAIALIAVFLVMHVQRGRLRFTRR